MATFTLDDIKAAAEAQYGSTEIDLGTKVVKLLNPLRLPKEKRQMLYKLQEEAQALQSQMEEGVEGVEFDQEEFFNKVLAEVCETPAQHKALMEKVGGDMAVLSVIFEKYQEGTQMGEASPSQS